MAEVMMDAVPQKVRDFFNKGFAAFERGRLDYAIDMLSMCLVMEPALLRARKFLRAAEVQKYKQENRNVPAKVLTFLKSLPGFLAASLALKGKNVDKALAATDQLLRSNPLFERYVFMFADAAEKAGLPEAAVQVLEIARDHNPDATTILERLGRGYSSAARLKEAVACFEKLCEMDPSNSRALKALKDAMALNSMSKDGWTDAAESGGTFRTMVRDGEEAKRLEQESKAVKSEQDIDDLIAANLASIETEPENVNYRRALARLYCQRKDFDQAIEVLKAALTIAPGDPEVENFLSDITVQKFDSEISRLREAGREEDAAAKEVERAQFLFDDLQDRVARYPNDLNLRFRYGVMLYENEYYTESIQQFQMAQRNPKRRPRALYYLGMCFRHKEQYDMAIEQLETAAGEIHRMDADKKDITYALGELMEITGNKDKAAYYFKQIYQIDIQYRDVADKVENVYTRH